MTSWFNKHLFGASLNSRKTLDHKAVFLCKLLARSIDESSYEQVRHRLEQSTGVETRVRITPEGLTSGSKKTARQVPIEFHPIESVEALTVDTVHFNVLICVIHCFGRAPKSTTSGAPDSAAGAADLALQIIAYKFDNDSLPRRYVDCFNSIKGRSTESDSKKKRKSAMSKKKLSKSISNGNAIEDEPDRKDARRMQSLIPGRLAAVSGSLAFDRWTARDRSTPRLFASASVDNLLGCDDDSTDASVSRFQSTMSRRTPTLAKNTIRSRSYEGGLDDPDPVELIIANEYAGDANDEGLNDLDADAAEAGAEFWKEADDDDNITGNALRAQFRGADSGLGRSLAASRGAWSSMDNMVDRRSIDNWSSGGDSSDVSGRLDVVSCHDVGITVRFPAATDPKSRPWRMDCYQFKSSNDDDGTADVQCQVDMPRLRQELAGKDSVEFDENITVNKMALSDEELDEDGGNGDADEDDDGWDFGSDNDDVTKHVPSSRPVKEAVIENTTKSDRYIQPTFEHQYSTQTSSSSFSSNPLGIQAAGYQPSSPLLSPPLPPPPPPPPPPVPPLLPSSSGKVAPLGISIPANQSGFSSGSPPTDSPSLPSPPPMSLQSFDHSSTGDGVYQNLRM